MSDYRKEYLKRKGSSVLCCDKAYLIQDLCRRDRSSLQQGHMCQTPGYARQNALSIPKISLSGKDFQMARRPKFKADEDLHHGREGVLRIGLEDIWLVWDG